MIRSIGITAFILTLVLLVISCNKKTGEGISETKESSQVEGSSDDRVTKEEGEYAEGRILRNPFDAPDTVIYFEQGPCFGECPVFSMTILSDGNVTYHGKMFVEMKGTYTSTISKKEIERIDRRLQKMDFFGMEAKYPTENEYEVADVSTTIVMSERGDEKHRIEINFDAPKLLVNFIEELKQLPSELDWQRSGGKN